MVIIFLLHTLMARYILALAASLAFCSAVLGLENNNIEEKNQGKKGKIGI